MWQGGWVATHEWDSRDEASVESESAAGAPAAAAPSRVQLMLQLQANGGNQAVGRLLKQDYPYASTINAALGRTAPLHSVVDPVGTAEAGVPAFTEGGVTHFADA